MARQIRQGFTLIELIIVVVIISILAMISLASYSGVNRRSRDARREADMQQIRAALEMYRTDVGEYPDGLVDLAGTYMNSEPDDPKSGLPYIYDSTDPTTYTLEYVSEVRVYQDEEVTTVTFGPPL